MAGSTSTEWGSEMMGYYGGYGLFGGLGMGFGMILWIGLIALVVWAAVALFNRSGRAEESPLETLKRRYARGEISEAEFERARECLE